MTPGILGTRLVYTINDCVKLPKDIKERCKFELACKNGVEFDLWVAWGKNNPANFITPNSCLGALMKLVPKGEGETYKALDRTGIKITWYGNS